MCPGPAWEVLAGCTVSAGALGEGAWTVLCGGGVGM